MNETLHEYLDIFVTMYLNDILIYSENEKEHVEHVKKVLAKLRTNSLLLKLEKCEFHKNQVEFLGYIIRTHGIKMD